MAEESSIILVNSLVCLFYIAWTIRAMVRSGKLRLLHISSVFVVLTNAVPIPFTNLGHQIFQVSARTNVAWIAFQSMTLFMFISLIFQFLHFYKAKKESSILYKNRLKANLWFWLVLSVGILAVFRFMIFGGGISNMGTVLSSLGDLALYYAARKETGETFGAGGQGVGGALLSITYLLPMIALISVYYAANRKKNQKSQVWCWLTFTISIALIVIVVITFAHRMMLAYLLILLIFATIIYRYKGNLELYFLTSRRPMLVISIFIGLILSAVYILSIASGLDFQEGFGALADRTFLIPTGTSSYYYHLFPDRFPYRGLLRSFQMGSEVENDVGFLDVAEAAMGERIGANACFVPIGYSGAGFLGVLVVSIVYGVIAVSADRLLNRLEPRLRFIGILLNFYGIIGLSSTPLLASVVAYGFGLSTFIFYFIMAPKRKNLDSRQQQGSF